MSRPLRIQEPGLWHHVMNRGLDRTMLFRVDADHLEFLELLAQIGPRWDVWCHAVVLMGNHYHLLLHDEGGNLGRAMRHIDGVFTQKHNRRHGRDGPLMRGRYRSRLVDHEEYLHEVVRYIHVNPVEVGLVDRAGDYRWSSHRRYLAGETPKWLRRDAVCERFGWDADGARVLDEFVHERIPDDVRKKLEARQWKPVLGSDAFEENWKHILRARGVDRQPEIADARKLTSLPVDVVIDAACDVFGVALADLQMVRRGAFNAPRQLALLVCRERCSAGNREIGKRFGVASTSVSNLVRRTRARLDDDDALRGQMETLMRRLGELSQVST